MAKADSPTKACTADGCARPLRARGLCSSHYNQQHQPDRHRKSTLRCVVCGEPTLKAKRQRHQPVCSAYCRWFLQSPVLSCPIPLTNPSHPDHAEYLADRERARVRRVTDANQLRAERAASVAALMQSRPCADCGQAYTPGTTVQRYCSVRCSRRVSRRERKAREHGAQGSYTWTQVIALFLLFDRCCAYCAQPISGQPDPDHVVPLSRGGHNGISNILPACRACNSDKRDLFVEDWNEDRERRDLPLRVTHWDPMDRRYLHLSPDLGLLTVSAA